MNNQDWLLLAIGDWMEPIRVQKTLFKFSKESDAPSSETYEFEPYNWGPCSFEIYDDLRSLIQEGFIEAIPSGRGWDVYQATDHGNNKQQELRKSANKSLIKQIDQARDYVVSRSFATLLEDVYEEYPDYAVNSVFRQ